MNKSYAIQSMNVLCFYKTPKNACEALEKLSPYAQTLYWLLSATSHSQDSQNKNEEIRKKLRHNLIILSKSINKSFFIDNGANQSTLYFDWLKELEDNHFIKILWDEN